MCVGEFGEGGDESGIDDVSVNYEAESREGGYDGYRKHFGTITVAQFNTIQFNSMHDTCVMRRKKGNGACLCIFWSWLWLLVGVSQPYDINDNGGIVHNWWPRWRSSFLP